MDLSLITHQKRDTENNSSTIFHRFLEMTVRTALFMNYRTKEANPVPLFVVEVLGEVKGMMMKDL